MRKDGSTVKKLFAIAVALVMGISVAATITGCPSKETKKDTAVSKDTESKKS